MSSGLDKNKLWEKAKSLGLEMLGIAPVERFKSLDGSGRPDSILPEARSVIVVGMSVPRGRYLGTEIGTLWLNADQRIGSRLLLSLSRFIEKDGWEAVPVLTHQAKHYPKTKPVVPGRPVPNVIPPYAYAAVAAGLGEIGYCGLFLTPAFGPRQSLGMIITDAEIEADPIFEGTICDHEQCKICAASCPSGAISQVKTVTVDICGKKMTLADINYELCRLCQNGAAPDFIYQKGSEELMPAMMGNQPQLADVSSVLSRKSVPNIQMALCNRSCINHLEENKRLDRQHHNTFRTEEPWKIQIGER
jgi:epoxyqueuosine reductase QueG